MRDKQLPLLSKQALLQKKKKKVTPMKAIVITGAAGGIGFETAKKMILEGYTVFGLDIELPITAEKLQDVGLYFIQTDLTDQQSVEKAFETVRAKTSQIEAILHMAGMYDLNSLVEMTEDEFIRIFDVNLFALYRVNKIFLPLLKKGGRIVMTSSELAPLDPLPFTGIYAITKTAVEKYAFALRMELSLLDHPVIVLRPGAIDTGLLNVSTKRLDDFCSGTALYSCNAKKFKEIVDRVEAKKIPPERIAKLACRAVKSKHPKYIYCINRNPLLLLMHLLPKRLQTGIIAKILKS